MLFNMHGLLFLAASFASSLFLLGAAVPTPVPSSKPTIKSSHSPSNTTHSSIAPQSMPSCSPSFNSTRMPTSYMANSTLPRTLRHRHDKKVRPNKGKKTRKCGSKKSSKRSSKKWTKKSHKATKKPISFPTIKPSVSPTMKPSVSLTKKPTNSSVIGNGIKSSTKVANASLCTDASGTFFNSLGLKKDCAWLDQDWKLSLNCGTVDSPATDLGMNCRYACRDFSDCSCINRNGFYMSSVGVRKSCDWLDGAIWKFTNNCGTSSIPPTELGLHCRVACSGYNDCAN